MLLRRRRQRRLVIAGLAASLAAPVAVIQPAAAAILYTCDSVTGSVVLSPGLVHAKRAQSASSGPTAPAGPADLTLASTSDLGVKGIYPSQAPSLSADGTVVAFQSQSTNLDPADSDTILDVYVKNLVTGDLTLASTSDLGVKGNNDSGVVDVSISADGFRVAFNSNASNLDPGDAESFKDVYVKDLTTGDIMLASTSDTGVKSNTGGQFASLSADGNAVAFETTGTNLDPADTDGVNDIYVKNLTTGDVTLASTSDTGVKANDNSFDPSVSADGLKVAFMSEATNLDPGDTDSNPDMYVKDLSTGDIALASTSDGALKGNAASLKPSLSPDGGRVAFSTKSTNLDPADSDVVTDVYVKNLITGDITLASTSDTALKGNNNSTRPQLTTDANKVAFESRATNLDLTEVTGTWDVYVKNLATGDITLASTSDNAVAGDDHSTWASPSADFGKVGFMTYATNLDAADTDNAFDIYVKQLPSTPTSIAIGGCSNGNSGTAAVVDIRSYGPRPLGCPTALGGAAGNDYADTMPILVGATLSMTIDWASGPNSYGVAAAKAGPTGTQWRFRLAITASPGHDAPATNQYLPAAGSGFTKTRLQGKLDISALDSFNCATGIDDPISWLSLANNGAWVAKTS